jgi:excisionase family DNA binding protein
MIQQKTQRSDYSPWLTVSQLAEYLSVSPGTVRNWVSQRYIPFAKRGRIVRFHRQRIDAWLMADACLGRPTIAQNISGAD